MIQLYSCPLGNTKMKSADRCEQKRFWIVFEVGVFEFFIQVKTEFLQHQNESNICLHFTHSNPNTVSGKKMNENVEKKEM